MGLAFGDNQGKISSRGDRSGETLSMVQGQIVLVGFVYVVVWMFGTEGHPHILFSVCF